MDEINLAILFWFYKEPKVTKNHLEIIRKFNPNARIFGLYGGNKVKSSQWESELGDLLDDFWTYPNTYGDSDFSKWINGDLMLLDWYIKRGVKLEWDSISIVQWDALLLTDIKKIVPTISKNQIFFSGYRELTDEIENRWVWTKPGGEQRKNYEKFRDYIKSKHNYNDSLKCCLFIYAILNRRFFDQYYKEDSKSIGMLEYKNPTLAKIFGLDIFEYDVGVYWRDNYESYTEAPLNALSDHVISIKYIKSELAKPNGWRLFHPVNYRVNLQDLYGDQ